MNQDTHGPTQDQQQQPHSQDESDPEESFPPSYEEAISHIDEDGSTTIHQHQSQHAGGTNSSSSSSNVNTQAFNLNDEIQNSDSDEAENDGERAYQESSPSKAGHIPDTQFQQTFIHPSASEAGASSPIGPADGHASPFGHQHQGLFDHHKQHHPHHMHGHGPGHGHGHRHGHGHGHGHHLQHQHLPPGFPRPSVEPSAPPAASESPASSASSALTTETSNSPSAARLPYLPPLNGMQGMPFPFMNGAPLPPHFLNARPPHPAFGHPGPAGFGGPGGFGPPGMFGLPPPGGFIPGVFPGVSSVPESMFPAGPPPQPPQPQPQPPQPPAFAPASSRDPEVSESRGGADGSSSPTASKKVFKFGQTEASTVAPATVPSSSASLSQPSLPQALASSPSTATDAGAHATEAITTTATTTGATTLASTPFFGIPTHSPSVPLSGIPNAPVLLNAQEVSIATFTRSKRGVESQDALLDDPYQLYRFFVAHNDRPSMHVLITGSHMEKQTTEERNSDGTLAAVEHKVKVDDFKMDFDLSPYISPSGTIMTLPDPKTGNKPTLREVMEEHVEEENPFKELHMEKRVNWDYEDLTRAITQAIRSVNYRYTIEISYPIFNHKVVVHSASPLATFMRSAWTKALCIISVVGIAIYPLREMYKKVKDKSLQSEFQMTISTRDFYMANYWNIIDQVQYK